MKTTITLVLALLLVGPPVASRAGLVGHDRLAEVADDVHVVVGSARRIGEDRVEIRLTHTLRSPPGRGIPRAVTVPAGDLRFSPPGGAQGIFLLRQAGGRYTMAGAQNPAVVLPAGLPVGAGDYAAITVDLLGRAIEQDDKSLCLSAGHPQCAGSEASAIRDRAVVALVEFKGQRSRAVLERLACDPRLDVAVHGHGGLAQLGVFGRGTDISGLISRPTPASLPALHTLGGAMCREGLPREARPAVLLLLGSTDAALRHDGACGLRALSEPTDLPLWSRLLTDSDQRVRYYAASAVAGLYTGRYVTTQHFRDNEAQVMGEVMAWMAEGPPRIREEPMQVAVPAHD
ncbi:HEAT repeat domain-containing protein [Ideonella sp.]|uniref:HEAT repeat domain-containing protein n=1 Tax=Ideonella sp. TaxID=1929293 RepID=UPI0035B2F3BC